MPFRRYLLWLTITIISVCAWSVFLYAYSGGLAPYGYRNDRKAGGFHCHRGPFAGQSFATKDETLRKLQAEKPGDIDTSKKTNPPKTP